VIEARTDAVVPTREIQNNGETISEARFFEEIKLNPFGIGGGSGVAAIADVSLLLCSD
jgi:hypothetical protein